MTKQDNQHAAFEAWYVTDCAEAGITTSVGEIAALRGPHGDYRKHAALHGKWVGWQAACEYMSTNQPKIDTSEQHVDGADIELPPLPPPDTNYGYGKYTERQLKKYARQAIAHDRQQYEHMKEVYRDHANVIAREALDYQKRIRDLEAQLQQRGEPVAWRWKWKDAPDQEWHLTNTMDWQKNGECTYQPLYAQPIAPQPAEPVKEP